MINLFISSPRPQKANTRKLRRDLRLLARFVEIYCRDRHDGSQRSRFEIKTHDAREIIGRELRLCPACTRLLKHAWTKRTHCPMNPKPQCKHCPQHCYRPAYRQSMKEVMRHSGRKLVLSGRLDYLFHLLG